MADPLTLESSLQEEPGQGTVMVGLKLQDLVAMATQQTHAGMETCVMYMYLQAYT